jgi:LacI family transcriptional regulator
VGADEDDLQTVANSGTPLVLLDRQVPIANAHFVGVNDLRVGQLATEHLISIGCKRIAHLRGPANAVGEKRFEGYKRAQERRHPVPPRVRYRGFRQGHREQGFRR